MSALSSICGVQCTSSNCKWIFLFEIPICFVFDLIPDLLTFIHLQMTTKQLNIE